MEADQDISNNLILAVSVGDLEVVRILLNSYGLSYSNDWLNGYVLLTKALEKKYTLIAKLLLTKGSKVNDENLINTNTPLHLAVINGDTEIVNLLITKGANINCKNRYGETPFYIAIKNDDVNITEIFLACKKIEDKFKDLYNKTPLQFATEKRSLQIIDYLLKREISQNFACSLSWKKNFTTLHWAALKGDVDIVNLLLKIGADINARGEDNITPLHVASNRGHDGVIKVLLNKGADVKACTKDNETPLHFAAKVGMPTTVKLLLQYGANIHIINNHGKSILYFAVQSGNLTVVKDILRYNPDIDNASNKQAFKIAIGRYEENYKKIVVALLNYGIKLESTNSESSLFHSAVKGGHFEVVKILLQSSCDVNALLNEKTEEGYTALHIAIKYEAKEIAKLLIDYGTNVNAKDKTEKTPIFYATISGDVTMTKLLLVNNANIKNNPDLLNNAVKKDSLNMVQALIDYNVDINDADDLGRGALYLTTYTLARRPYRLYNNDEVIIKAQIAKLLLINGAKVNATTKNGQTPLHAAVEKGYRPVIEVLLQHGADVKACDIHKQTTVHFCVLHEIQDSVDCCCNNGNPEDNIKAEIVNSLLRRGVNINAQNKNGLTALHLATQNGYVKVVEVLLQHNANIKLRDMQGRTALHFTVMRDTGCFYKNLATDDHNSKVKGTIAKMLLNKGANVEAKTKNGQTVLLTATERRYIEVVEALLEYNANSNSRVRNGFSPLHIATEKGFHDIVEVLLNFGADAKCKDDSNRTVLYIASQNNHAKIVTTLLEYGSYYNILYTDNTSPLQCYMKTINRRNNNQHNNYCSDLDYLYFFDASVNEAFQSYIVKLKAANLFALEAYSESLKLDYEMITFLQKCEIEVTKMKDLKFESSNISFYDIITKTTKSLATFMRNENIVDAIQAEYYKYIFPEYASMIKCHFTKAMNRKALIEKSNQIFDLLGLPINCCEKIFGYLSDIDLRMLINSNLYPHRYP